MIEEKQSDQILNNWAPRWGSWEEKEKRTIGTTLGGKNGIGETKDKGYC